MQATIIVTGAAQGIGAAVCTKLIQQGLYVIGLDRQAIDQWPILGALSEELHQDFKAVQLDLSDIALMQATLNPLLAQHKVTGLVSAAGVLHLGPLLTLQETDWEHTYLVNLKAPMFLMQYLAQYFIKQNQGRMVCISSNAAKIPRMNLGAYATSKAALSHFCKNLALELAPYGITCNVISPGSTRTPMQQQLWTDEHVPESIVKGDLAQFRTGIPLGKIAEPEDMAHAVAFFLSDQAAHITMQELVIDGGATLGA